MAAAASVGVSTGAAFVATVPSSALVPRDDRDPHGHSLPHQIGNAGREDIPVNGGAPPHVGKWRTVRENGTENLRDAPVAQAARRVRGALATEGRGEVGAQPLGKFRAGPGHVVEGLLGDVAAATLHDYVAEEPVRQRRDEQVEGVPAPGRLPENRDVVRVSTEVSDVLLHPRESGELIEHRVVARGVVLVLGSQSGVCDEAEGAETVVDGDNDDPEALKREAVVVEDVVSHLPRRTAPCSRRRR